MSGTNPDMLLSESFPKAKAFEAEIKKAVIGQDQAVRLLTIAVFARGHALLEGSVGVGKTTLLKATAKALGGASARIEGTIDLMPSDLIYYTHLDASGKPAVAPGPLLDKGERLATFFFNEINRARPQVHSLLLRVMAERSIHAFNREHFFPFLQIFADRNRVEREETFELPAATRDRFMLELEIKTPVENEVLDDLAFNPRYHDAARLINEVNSEVFELSKINLVADAIQSQIETSTRLRDYVRELWRASSTPEHYGIQLEGVESEQLLEAGPSPRAMSHLIRASRVRAWLNGRSHVYPEDIQDVFPHVMRHRLFFSPVFEYRRQELAPVLIHRVLETVSAP